ncbi:MAG: flagellin FliC [Deltaproteobacteria bacterium HGW-Deltaproteobacteria-14]|jgi:flagellin|nr:MAG: flagellin FliC [Deltaproteobacteria bacterium HGW-Deltaproteobacteria-14]
MPLTIGTNGSSLAVQKTLTTSNSGLNSSIKKLSSGMRITSSSDDAAGLAVAEGLKAQTRGYQQGMSNAQQGVAMLQTADSAQQTISDTLIRMRELAVQASSDSLTDTERAYVNTEFTALAGEIDRTSNVTEYNGQKLLDGTAGAAGTLTFQVGTRNTSDDRVTMALADSDATALGVNAATVDSLANAQASIDSIDAAIDTLNTSRATVGATMNQLGRAIDNLGSTIENLSVAEGGIRDVDVAQESANFSKQQVLQQAGVSMLAQANASPQFALRLLS